MKYRNSNILKNTALILAAILLVGGSFIYAEYRNDEAKKVYDASPAIVADTTPEVAQELDTDGDGSKDWEEVLFGTSPTDPKSKPSSEKPKTTADLTATSSTEKLSNIDLVSREFFARYMELRQLGGSTDKASQEELAYITASKIVLSKPAVYKENEIVTKADVSTEAIKAYGQAVGNVFKTYSIQSRNEAVIAKDSFEKEDETILKEIDPIIVSYKNIINALIKIPAPQNMAMIHLDLVNAMNEVLFVAQSFRNSDKNAVEGMQGVQYYLIASQHLADSVNAIRSFLTYSGINEKPF